MSASAVRARVLRGGLCSLAVVAAPLAVALGTTPAGAATAKSPHAVQPSSALRSFLPEQARTFPPAVATFSVNTTNDTDATNPAGGVCADSAGQCSVRAALDVANALGETVTVTIPAGTYALTLGGLDITDPAGVQLMGAGAAATTIAASGPSPTLDVFGTTASGGFAGLTNLTLTGGEGIGVDQQNATLVMSGAGVSGASFVNGGGIDNMGQLWATNSTFQNNSATDNGGAIFNDQGSVRLSGDTFIANTAGDVGGAVDDEGPMSLDSSTFTSNTVSSATGQVSGGAIFSDGQSELTNDVFTGNSATTTAAQNADGGAIYDAAGMTVTGSTFTNNSTNDPAAQAGEGGAYFDGSTVTINSSTFAGNSAVNGEGGALSDEGSSLILSNSIVSGNSALGSGIQEGDGGGVYANDQGTFSSDTFRGNHADQQGGGIWEDDAELMTSSLISNNTSTLGAGVYDFWIFQATSTAIVDNVASGAGNAGGGVYLPGRPGANNRVDFQAVTVAGNVADSGAGFGIESDGGQTGGGTLANSTVGFNRTPAGAEQDCALIGTMEGLPLSSAGGNVVGDNACAFTTSSDRQGASQQGYWMTASDGGVFTYNARFFGSMGGKHLNKPIVGMAHTPGNQGYWEVASDGGVFTFGDAGFDGSMGAKPLNAPVVGIASMPDGLGYWEVASDGGVFTFGDAGFYGSMGGQHLNAPIVAIAVTPDGRGYWEVASDGGIFNFGDAGFFGSMGGTHLNKPIVGMAAAVDGAGYDEVASDGGIFNFGSAPFFGSAGSLHLNAPVVGIAAAPDNAGYWTFAADGGVFTYAASPSTGAQFMGSAGSLRLVKPVVAGAGT